MSPTMTLTIVSILMRGTVGPATIYTFILVMLAAGVAVLVAIFQVFLGKWIERTRCRSWPTESAKIDLMSVADVADDARYPSYRATLTYIYRNPEEQMGDYSRDFASEDEAHAWANSYKGETVKAYVNPRDPTRSFLREEDFWVDSGNVVAYPDRTCASPEFHRCAL
jgi:hypothetical protein